MSVTISSTTANGLHVEITLAKTSADKGTVTVKQWENGEDPKTDPPNESETELYDIRGKTDGSKVVCKGNVFGPDPVITFDVKSPVPPKAGNITVTIEGAWAQNGTTEYEISEADRNKIKKFVLDSKFPALA